MAVQVAEGVYQLKVPIPGNALVPDSNLGYTLVYLVEEPGGWVMIDAGWNSDEGWQALHEQAGEVLGSLSDIRTLVVTHFHPDHLGLAQRVKEVSGAQVVMHRGDVEGVMRQVMLLMQEDLGATLGEWLARVGVPDEERQSVASLRGYRGPFLPEVEVDHALEEAERVVPGTASLYALWTPGHSPGHLCVYDAGRKLLFTGDHVLPGISPNVGLFPSQPGNPLGDYLESLKRVWRMEVDRVLPAHEQPFQDLLRRTAELFEHHRERLQAVVQACWDEPRTAYQIAAKLSWRSLPWQQMPALTRLMALFETLAHLRLLTTEGYVEEIPDQGALRYGATHRGTDLGEAWWSL